MNKEVKLSKQKVFEEKIKKLKEEIKDFPSVKIVAATK